MTNQLPVEVSQITFTVEELDYLWLLTALDAMRIHAMENGAAQDLNYSVRHSVRDKLLRAPKIAPGRVEEFGES